MEHNSFPAPLVYLLSHTSKLTKRLLFQKGNISIATNSIKDWLISWQLQIDSEWHMTSTTSSRNMSSNHNQGNILSCYMSRRNNSSEGINFFIAYDCIPGPIWVYVYVILINCKAREIIRLVVSVRPFGFVRAPLHVHHFNSTGLKWRSQWLHVWHQICSYSFLTYVMYRCRTSHFDVTITIHFL